MALPLDRPAGGRDEAFLTGPSNLGAVGMLERWREWPVRSALLTGPARSGRTLLASWFARSSGAVVIDDAPDQPEEAVFHAWNRAQETGRPLLIVAHAPPPGWAVGLPDLATRLAASPLAVIGPPDDVLARALIVQQFDRRTLAAPPELVDWLLARTERSHAAIEAVVAALDRLSLERRRRLSIPLARTLLIDAGLLAGPPEDS